MPTPSSRASAGDHRAVSRGGMTSDLSFPCGRKRGAPTPPVRECAAPAEQLELISPDKFQFATLNWGVGGRNPRSSCTDPWRRAAAGSISPEQRAWWAKWIWLGPENLTDRPLDQGNSLMA